MALSFAQFMAAIAAQESGGNYGSVNKGSGALGKYQVMPSNIAAWSKEALGHSITARQFLDSPQLQEQIVSHKLQLYFTKYGARGAAAAWYSGKPERQNDYSHVSSGPSVGAYVDQVLGRAGQAPAGRTTTTNSTSGGGGMPNAQDATDTYGYIAQLSRQVPELNNILNQAISGGWTPDKFQHAVQDSLWWKTHSDSVRQRLIQQSTDPASYKQDLAEAYRRVDQMQQQAGLHLDLHKRNYAAQQILMGGWSDVDLHSYLGGHGSFTGGGEVEQTRSKLRVLMADYAQFASPGQVDYATRRILSGADTIDTWQARWRKQAESMFPGLKAELEQGQTVRQVMDPYVSQYAQTLELDPAAIDITRDPLLRRALTVKDEKGHPSTMPLWQFEQELRKDPRRDKTNGAKNETYALLDKVGKGWGYSA